MEFVIKFDDASELFIMNGWAELLVIDHLQNLAKVFGVLEVFEAYSETHAVAILNDNGVNVKLDFEY